jgi:hypothetical protein
VPRLQQGDLFGKYGIATALLAGSQAVCEALRGGSVSKVGMAQFAACPYAAPLADDASFTEKGSGHRYRVEAALAAGVINFLKYLNHGKHLIPATCIRRCNCNYVNVFLRIGALSALPGFFHALGSYDVRDLT